MIDPQQSKQHTYDLLAKRGVTVEDIAEIVFDLQHRHVPGLTLEKCIENVHKVLGKREVQNAVITGIELDIAAEQGAFSPFLTQILMKDEGLYGIDEILALSITNVYGSIGLTNFGYVDKHKKGIIASLNSDTNGKCNTFIDDIVGAIAAAAAGKTAHENG